MGKLGNLMRALAGAALDHILEKERTIIRPDIDQPPIARASTAEIQKSAQEQAAGGDFEGALRLLLEKVGYEVQKKAPVQGLLAQASQIALRSRDAKLMFLYYSGAADAYYRAGDAATAARNAKQAFNLAIRCAVPRMAREIYPLYRATAQKLDMHMVESAARMCVQAGDAATAAYLFAELAAAAMTPQRQKEMYAAALDAARRAGPAGANVGRRAAEWLLTVEKDARKRRLYQEYLELTFVPQPAIDAPQPPPGGTKGPQPPSGGLFPPPGPGAGGWK